jgi:hypothetical protein
LEWNATKRNTEKNGYLPKMDQCLKEIMPYWVEWKENRTEKTFHGNNKIGTFVKRLKHGATGAQIYNFKAFKNVQSDAANKAKNCVIL